MRINDEERRIWVLNDEGLYCIFRKSRLSMRGFIKAHRGLIDDCIKAVTTNSAPAHYLRYGAGPHRPALY